MISRYSSPRFAKARQSLSSRLMRVESSSAVSLSLALAGKDCQSADALVDCRLCFYIVTATTVARMNCSQGRDKEERSNNHNHHKMVVAAMMLDAGDGKHSRVGRVGLGLA